MLFVGVCVCARSEELSGATFNSLIGIDKIAERKNETLYKDHTKSKGKKVGAVVVVVGCAMHSVAFVFETSALCLGCVVVRCARRFEASSGHADENLWHHTHL